MTTILQKVPDAFVSYDIEISLSKTLVTVPENLEFFTQTFMYRDANNALLKTPHVFWMQHKKYTDIFGYLERQAKESKYFTSTICVGDCELPSSRKPIVKYIKDLDGEWRFKFLIDFIDEEFSR